MKAILSDRLRKILMDPKANMELKKCVSRLNNQYGESLNPGSIIRIGNHKYKVHFIALGSQIKK